MEASDEFTKDIKQPFLQSDKIKRNERNKKRMKKTFITMHA